MYTRTKLICVSVLVIKQVYYSLFPLLISKYYSVKSYKIKLCIDVQ